MTLNTNDPVILSAVRTPFGKRKGALRETRPDALLAGILQQPGTGQAHHATAHDGHFALVHTHRFADRQRG